jgi:CrcB protein
VTSSTGPTAASPGTVALLGLVVLGGALGATGRAALILPIKADAPALALPMTTLVINVVGSLVLGVVVGVLGSGSPRLRAFLGTGILGGFTTYSAFAVQVVRAADGRAPLALALAVASLLLGVAAALAGLLIGRRFAREPLTDTEDAE